MSSIFAFNVAEDVTSEMTTAVPGHYDAAQQIWVDENGQFSPGVHGFKSRSFPNNDTDPMHEDMPDNL